MRKRHPVPAGLGVVLAVMLMTSACGEESPKSAASGARPADAGASLVPSAASTSTAPPAASAGQGGMGGSQGASGGQLGVRQDAALGSVVTDDKGFTLYRFDDDVPKPSKSSCEGQCAQTWPPVMADGVKAGTGIEQGAVGRVQRSDGMQQLTLGGWPVYRYSKDTAAGQTNGQGVQGKWNALAPDGKKAAKAGKDGEGSKGGGRGEGGKGGGRGEGGEPKESDRSPSGKKDEEGLTVIVTPAIGSIIVNSRGRPLYLHSSGSPWNCEKACRNLWRPARPVNRSRISGINISLIGEIKLPDGSFQLTIGGQPMFWYTDDREKGRAGGQGRDNCWAVSPNGSSARPPGRSK
ncbi:SCO0930 family lipoprotein [Streptomyces roseoverticillatus]|uniref:SCO0930 family lipoprotein n=1 Tax=Streptomyces roseoverticillatus TaxID=66429 RepID=UPI00340EAD13